MDKLIVSTSPHFRSKTTTSSIMRDVIIALLPAAVAGVVFFGMKALLIIAVCTGTCVASEFLFNLIAKKKQTRMGRLTAGTRYGDYAIENKWLLDNDTFIEAKPPKAEFMLGMKYQGIMYGFWVDYDQGLIFVNKQFDPSSYSLYCLTKEDHEANLLLIKSLGDKKQVQRIVFAFRNGLLRFEDMQVKNQFYEYIGFFVR